MPASLVAVGVLLTLFVPGYLFQAGVREHNSILTAERDLYAIAQAVAISAGFLIFLSLLVSLGDAVFDGTGLRDELLHNPASAEDPGLTAAQAGLLLWLLVFPVPIGRFFGWAKTRHEKSEGGGESPFWLLPLKPLGWCLTKTFGFFFRPAPIVDRLDDLARTADEAPVYVRIVTQGGEDVIGVMDAEAAAATRSELGQGLALSAQWAPGDGSAWRQLPGTHIGGRQIVKIFTWQPGAGPLPVWLIQVPGLGPAPPQ